MTFLSAYIGSSIDCKPLCTAPTKWLPIAWEALLKLGRSSKDAAILTEVSLCSSGVGSSVWSEIVYYIIATLLQPDRRNNQSGCSIGQLFIAQPRLVRGSQESRGRSGGSMAMQRQGPTIGVSADQCLCDLNAATRATEDSSKVCYRSQDNNIPAVSICG